MHETVFSKEIIRVLNQKLKSLNVSSKITCVNVRLSPLSHVKPETLRLAFLQMVKASSLEDISLNINSSEVELECKSCARRFLVKEPLFVCTHCKGRDFHIKQEHEFFVESIEIVKKDRAINRRSE